MNYTLHISLCVLLVMFAVAVGLYRKYLEDHCDHYLHLHDDSHDASIVSSQSAICKRIEMLDKLKNGLIAAAVVYAVAVAGFASYLAWNRMNS